MLKKNQLLNDPNSASPTEMQNSKGGKDGVAGLSGDPPEQQDLQNAVEDSEDNKANSEAMRKKQLSLMKKRKRKSQLISETVTPEDAEVAEIDAMHSKVDQRTRNTCDIRYISHGGSSMGLDLE